MTTLIDLTGLDIDLKATTRGGTRRLNLRDSAGALDLTGVTSFTGEILDDRTTTLGTGTDVTWPVVDAAGGGVACTIPTALAVGTHWVYVSAVVDGSTVEISGPLTITTF